MIFAEKKLQKKKKSVTKILKKKGIVFASYAITT